MEKTRFIELLRLKESGRISLLEQRELGDLMDRDESLRAIAAQMAIFDDENSNFNAEETLSVNDQWLRLKNSIEKNNTVHKKGTILVRFWQVAAAAVIIALGALFFVLSGKKPVVPLINQVSTQASIKTNIVLPDGSKVWLNSQSKLRYARDFGAKDRELELTGEAFFEVVHDSTRPFIVHTKAADVRVLGTVFNVRAYDSDTTMQTTLLQGAVELRIKKNDKKILLKPLEKITIRRKMQQQNDLVVLDTLTTEGGIRETQWIPGRLSFGQAPLEEVLFQLKQHYGVTFTVHTPALLKRKVSGVYANEDIREVMESLSLAIGFKYEINNTSIILY